MQLGFTEREMTGISLALGGNILISVSLNTQKYAHNQNAMGANDNKSYLKNPVLPLPLFGQPYTIPPSLSSPHRRAEPLQGRFSPKPRL